MILPLFFMIFLAILWFGQAFRIYGTITRAAREGARAAVAPVCTTLRGRERSFSERLECGSKCNAGCPS